MVCWKEKIKHAAEEGKEKSDTSAFLGRQMAFKSKAKPRRLGCAGSAFLCFAFSASLGNYFRVRGVRRIGIGCSGRNGAGLVGLSDLEVAVTRCKQVRWSEHTPRAEANCRH